MSAGIVIVDVIAKASSFTGRPHYFLLLDRMPEWVYSRTGNVLLAQDDGFSTALVIEPGTTRAFAGREFDIRLADGSTYHCAGQAWSCGIPDEVGATVEVGVGTLETLGNCYVFTGASVSREKLNAWLAANVPSTNYYKYDKRSSMEWVDKYSRYGAKPVCAKRARTLRRRGVTLWRDEQGRRVWSPNYERRKREVLETLANDPGSVRIGGAA